MRTMKYLSPTSLKMFYENRENFYLQYLCDKKTPRPPQTNAMAVGSAFDAYVKSFLVEKLVGKRPEFERDTIFTAQVESHNRDEAKKAGEIVFKEYSRLGALSDLLIDLEGCIGEPRFETTVEGYVSAVSLAFGDVPFLGKPDIFFITKQGARIIFDWKVNGYYSNYNVSPKAGYTRIRSSDPKLNGKVHPKAMVMDHQGIKISITHPLDTVDREWAAQLSIYSWLLGQDIGSKFIVGIDQIFCGNDDFGGKKIGVAQHRSIVNESFQQETFKKANEAWKAIQSGHVFFECPRPESDARCVLLDAMADTPPDPAFDAILR